MNAPKKSEKSEPEAVRHEQADPTPTSPAPSGDALIRPLDAPAPERVAAPSEAVTSPVPSIAELVEPVSYERPDDQVLPVRGMASRIRNPVGLAAQREAAYAE